MIWSPERTSLVMPTTPETAGMPRLRDRIAAWLVPPPVSVTIPAIGRFPRLIAWLGRISWATRMTGSSPQLGPCAPPGDSGRIVRCEPIFENTSRTSVSRSRK